MSLPPYDDDYTPPPERFTPQSYEVFIDAPPLRWLIKNVLPRAELGIVFGESGSGKSFMALNMIMAIVRGIDWYGNRTSQGRVVYICAEGAGGFRNRLKAYMQRHGLLPEDVQTLQIIPDAPNFLHDIDPLNVAYKVGKADLIVIDTFARVTPGGNENDGKDMGAAIARCQLIHKQTGAMVLLVHHSGKDASKGSRGWSGIKAAADTEIEVTRIGNDRKASVTKQKDGSDDLQWGFNLLPYDLGPDEDGDMVTTCVYEPQNIPAERTVQRPLKGMKKIVMDTIQHTLKHESKSFVLEDVLVQLVENITPSPAPNQRDTRKQHIKRAIIELIGAELVHIDNGKIYITKT